MLLHMCCYPVFKLCLHFCRRADADALSRMLRRTATARAEIWTAYGGRIVYEHECMRCFRLCADDYCTGSIAQDGFLRPCRGVPWRVLNFSTIAGPWRSPDAVFAKCAFCWGSCLRARHGAERIFCEECGLACTPMALHRLPWRPPRQRVPT